jgi:hypothetical protein
MPQTYKSRIARSATWFVALFLLLFLFRLLYGYFGATNAIEGAVARYDYFGSLNIRKNYASENQFNQGPKQFQPDNSFTSSKYEKTAAISTGSGHFDADDSLVRNITSSFGGAIQYEKSLGKKSNRELHLSIGVRPVSFDSFYRAIQGVGTVRSTTITKVDKTNEYRQLNAKKISLEKNLASLNELRNRNGAISDYVGLHEKILEVETQLQELGVDLGNFNTENEFCTLHLSLFEGQERKATSFLQRVKIALEWTIKYYAVGVVAFAAVLVCSFLLLLIIDRFKLLSVVVARAQE